MKKNIWYFIFWCMIILAIEFAVFFIYYYQNYTKMEKQIKYIFETLSDKSITTIEYEKDNKN